MMGFGGYEFVRRVLLTYGNSALPEVRWYVILLIGAIIALVMVILGKTQLFRRKQRRINRNGDRNPRMEYHDDNNFLDADMSFGSGTIRYDRDVLAGGDVDSSFGDYTIDLTGVTTFAQDCLLKIDQSFGNITLLLPKHVRLVKSSDTSFAAFTSTGNPDPDATQTIIIRADVNFGSLQVKYL